MKTPRHILIGSRGMLGRAWLNSLEESDTPFITLDRPEIDLADTATIDSVPIEPGDIVVLCAGWTDVDGAEEEETRAHAVNATGPGHLALRCSEIGARLVYYSTDYVFGEHDNQRQPWAVDATPCPINAYGRTKLAGERAVASAGKEHLIVRTSWLYAPWGQNFILTMLRLAKERERLQVVDDQHGRPTSVTQLTTATRALMEAERVGLWHVAGGGEATWCDMATAAIDAAGLNATVTPCSTDEMPRPAPRPPWSVLDLRQTENAIGPMPTWPEEVARVVAA
ncbi:MAG: dTDP-4-dehydrorhamnose reductase, partial [Phycisphaeraceae bacterium]|nr:dTDP-4-dehydrorhamnose reductase [Phycisphaeraceae bacterium]